MGIFEGRIMASLDQSHRKSSIQKKLIVTSMATALGLVVGAPIALGQQASLEEIIVTARQRSESSQDIPMTIQSLSGDDIQKRGITTLEDFSRFVGNLSVQTTAPGQNTIVFRGVSDGGGFLVDPTAAIYLDEQPMSMTSMAPDVYPVDIARVEALAGPQSTLFGASSQTGTIRVITNKPDASEFSGDIGLGMSGVAKGDNGYDFDATVNIPVIKDKLAIRLSGFSAEDGGFIDSVLGTTVVDAYSGLGGLKTNAGSVENDINNVEWSGGRISARWLVSDDWTATLSSNFQDITANGFNDMDGTVGDLETVKFYDEFRTDDWTQTSLVIEGDLGFAQLTVAGSYYDRETAYQHDTQTYTAYFMYTFGTYLGYATYDFGTDPVGYLTNIQENKSDVLEVRLTGSGDKVDWTVGAFYMDSDETWDFRSYVDGYANSPAFAAWAGYAAYYNLTIAPTDAWWRSNQTTQREDKAFFGEIDIKLTDRLSLLAGGRWYEVDRNIEYFVEKPAGNPNLATPGRSASDDGFIPKFGLQYDLTDDLMVWGIYSEGYRVGGTNRGRGIPTLPVDYGSDIVENTEFGLKSTWNDGKVQVNATLYEMQWNDMQLEVTDPSFAIGEPWQAVVANLGDASISGADLDVKAVIGENLQVGFNITRIFHAYVDAPESYADPRFPGGQAPLGLTSKSDLPLFADTSYSLYLEYTTQLDLFDGGDAYVRFQHSYSGDSLNQVNDGGNAPRQAQGDYRISDLVMGYEMGDWKAQLSLSNIGDERGVSYKDSSDFDPFYGRNSDNVVRPRNYSISLRRYF
ncbi:MAG: iron complex outermembrane receptor protein [Porticoccaceae bacterium]|jgi:iron complex outermembrane receptor protein|tara:strand:- start:112 stop:2511 length:2400 start_codon:yes stop_codon:yes gene_type:complete